MEFRPVQNSLHIKVLRSPVLAVLLQGTPAAGICQTLRRGTRNGITKLSLGNGPHSSSIFFLLSFLVQSQRSQIGCLAYFYTWRGPSGNLECRSEMCCTRLAGKAGPRKSPEIRHLGTIAQLCRTSQLRHLTTIGKNIQQQCLPHMSSHYGELRPTSG